MRSRIYYVEKTLKEHLGPDDPILDQSTYKRMHGKTPLQEGKLTVLRVLALLVFVFIAHSCGDASPSRNTITDNGNLSPDAPFVISSPNYNANDVTITFNTTTNEQIETVQIQNNDTTRVLDMNYFISDTANFNFNGGTFPGIGGSCGNFLSPGSTCILTLRFSSGVSGNFLSNLVINYRFTNDTSGFDTGTIALQGQQTDPIVQNDVCGVIISPESCTLVAYINYTPLGT